MAWDLRGEGGGQWGGWEGLGGMDGRREEGMGVGGQKRGRGRGGGEDRGERE